MRHRFNDAVLKAVSIRGRKIPRTEFSEVLEPLFSRRARIKTLNVDLGGRYSNQLDQLIVTLSSLVGEILSGSQG